jgi:DNA-binding response OmpR family regulator
MLKIDLQIEESYLLTAFQELLPQAGICIKENEKEADCLLFTPPATEGCRPSLNFLSLSRPLRFLDLLSLLEALPYSQEIIFAHFSLDVREKILKNLNTQESQRLTEKESQLIRFFHQHRGIELSKEMLLQEIWAYHPDAETHTLETHIYRLRQKVEEDPNNPQIILNGREGYVLE